MKKYLLLLFLSYSFSISAQNVSFFKTYASLNGGELKFFDIAATADNGYVAAGYNYFISGGGDFVVLKTDSLGNEQWRFTNNEYDGQDYDNYAQEIIKTLDNGYLIVGRIYVPTLNGAETIYAKFDSAGNLSWKKRLHFAAYPAIFNTSCLINDSNIIIAGRTGYNNFVSNINSNSGDTLWVKLISDTSGFALEIDKITSVNLDYYLSGRRNYGSNNFSFVIKKMNNLFQPYWRKEYTASTTLWIVNDLINYNNDSIKFLLDYKHPQTQYQRMFKELTIDTAGNVLQLDSSALWGYENALYLKDSVIGLPGALSNSADTAGLGVIMGLSGQFEQWCTYYAPDAQDYGMCSRNQHEVAVCGGIDDGNNTTAIAFIMKSSDISSTIYLSELAEEKHLVSVHPVPASNLITFTIPTLLYKKYPMYSITIYDESGKITYSQNKITTESIQLNLSQFAKGTYSYHMYVPSKDIARGKFIIH